MNLHLHRKVKKFILKIQFFMKATTKTTAAATPNSGKERAIIEFSNADYAQVRACLLEAIDGSDFFSATVTSEHPAFESELVATIIVYRNSEGEIYDLVPVWWEMHTYDPDTGEELLNDFSFRTLRDEI